MSMALTDLIADIEKCRRSRDFEGACRLIVGSDSTRAGRGLALALASLGCMAFELEQFDLALRLLQAAAVRLPSHVSASPPDPDPRWLVGLAHICAPKVGLPPPGDRLDCDVDLALHLVIEPIDSHRPLARDRIAALEGVDPRSPGDELALWHLRLALCQFYRRRVQRRPWDTALADEAREWIEEVLAIADGPGAAIYDGILSMVPVAATASYELAALEYSQGRLNRVDALTGRILTDERSEGHIAAGHLRLQAWHAIGRPRTERRKQAGALDKSLRNLADADAHLQKAVTHCCSSEPDEAPVPDLRLALAACRQAGAPLRAPRARVSRQRALIESTHDVERALEYREEADKLDPDEGFQRYGHLRLLALKGDRAELLSATDQLLFDLTGQPPSRGLPLRAGHAAVRERRRFVIETMRATKRKSFADG